MFLCLLALCSAICLAQGSVRGKTLDKTTNESMPFVNASVYAKGSSKLVKGAITDEDGLFHITDLPYGDYTLKLTYMGYKTLERSFTLSAQKRHVG